MHRPLSSRRPRKELEDWRESVRDRIEREIAVVPIGKAEEDYQQEAPKIDDYSTNKRRLMRLQSLKKRDNQKRQQYENRIRTIEHHKEVAKRTPVYRERQLRDKMTIEQVIEQRNIEYKEDLDLFGEDSYVDLDKRRKLPRESRMRRSTRTHIFYWG